MTHICATELIGLDYGLSYVRCQAIILTIDGLSLFGIFGTNFTEIKMQQFFQKMNLENGIHFVSASMC